MGDARLERGATRIVWIVTVALVLAAIGLVTVQSLCLCGGATGAKKVRSLSNLKQLGLAHMLYVEDWSGFGPPPATWVDSMWSYHHNAMSYESPHEGRKKGEYGYAYYRPLGEVKEWAIQNKEEVPMLFDSSDLRRNANGDMSLLPNPPRWLGETNLFAFLDGHVKSFRTPPKLEIKLPD
jgi:hypothetical protein